MLLKLGNLKCVFNRALYTSSITMDKAIEKLQQNPYFDKYADRIAQLQRTSPEDFKNRVESAHSTAEAERRTKFASSPDTRY